MKQSTRHLLRVCSLTVALFGSVAFVAVLAAPEAAFAKSGNEGGNGNGNGGGNGNGHGGGGGNAKGESKAGGADKAAGKTKGAADGAGEKKKAPKVAAKTKRLADELGVSPSELGALNAANANPNALKNAAPNSRVGRIAAYRDAVLAGRALEEALQGLEADLADLTLPERSLAEIEAALDAAEADVAAKAGDVAALEAELAAAGGSDAAIEADLAAANDALIAAQDAQMTVEDELADAVAYTALEAEIEGLEADLAAQPETERSLLEAAANKPVTDAVEAAVKRLLGL